MPPQSNLHKHSIDPPDITVVSPSHIYCQSDFIPIYGYYGNEGDT